jgi:hypothetical protein
MVDTKMFKDQEGNGYDPLKVLFTLETANKTYKECVQA